MVMSRNMSYYFIGIITIYFYIFISSSLNTFASPTQPLCRRDQSDALLELEKEFHIPPTFWNKSLDCCFWNGVTCDDTLGEVIKLKHSSVDVTSLKPRSGLFKLQHLTHLDLSYCNIQGEIPSSIGNLSRLVYLDLSFNQLGEFPVAIGNLNNLEYVDLRANGLLGELPSSIGNLNQLRYMDLERNELRGNIPISFANFTKLSEIHLARNQFTGGIIVFSNLTSLIHIDISSNRFKSFISSEFSRLTNLTRFWAHNNSFFGHFPTFLFENPSLYEIDLSRNQFTGPIDFGNTSSISKLIKLNAGYNNFDGIIPNSISKLVNLNSLDLSHNNFRGKVPNSISKLVYKYLTNLDISYNMLEGQIPQCLWKNLGLSHVDLSNNLFNTFGKFVKTSDTNIKEIDLGSNLLQGPIPGWICNLPHVEFIDLSNNYFTGSVPKCIKNLVEINTLNLQNNNLSGFLPDLCINDSMYHSLRSLDVSRNNLVGKLPKSLNSCENIEFLDVGGNKISDSFPFWLGSLQRLNILVLKSNEFYGPVYNSSTYLGFPSMKIIDISNNNFTGSLPRDYFVSWPAMSYVWSNEGGSPESEYMGDLNGYEDSIDFVYKGVYTDFDRIFQNFKAIDFSGNLFSGHIPDSIGLLSELRLLNLSGNTFMGKIPPSLENITKLETLDLSRNNLSGEIPEGIGKLSFLSNINFSYNYLEGLVPRSTQFGTQNCTSFVGNIGLYGFKETCGEIHRVPVSTSQQPEKSSEAEEQVINWVAAAITFVPGVFCGLVLGHIFISYKHEWFVASSAHFSRGFVKFVLNK